MTIKPMFSASPGQRLRRGFWMVVSTGSLASAVGCGGTSDSERPTQEPSPILSADPGGNPADCTDDDGVVFSSIEDWETGAGTGWFTNNDQCEACNDLLTELSENSTAIRCAQGLASGCLEPARRSSLETLLSDQLTEDELGQATDEELEALAVELVVDLTARQEELLIEIDECTPDCEPVQTPSFFLRPVSAAPIIRGPRCGSVFALSMKTELLRVWGGTVGRNFSVSEPIDASDFDGVAFWARRGPDGREVLRVSLADRFTDENAPPIDGEPPCLFEITLQEPERGCDKFGGSVQLTTDWRFYRVPFLEMRQNGFGSVAPFFDIQGVRSISFDFTAGLWDLWIDDLGFYRNR